MLVSEDHESVRRFLEVLLRSQFDVVAAVGNGEELVKSAVLFQPDLIVSDIVMPLMDGLSARKELLSRRIDIPFVFITLDTSLVFPDPHLISYVHKLDLSTELIQAVRVVAGGGVYHSQTFRTLWGNLQ